LGRSPGLPDRSRIRIDRSAYALAKVKKLKITIKKSTHKRRARDTTHFSNA
jgi:hypothetical protein